MALVRGLCALRRVWSVLEIRLVQDAQLDFTSTQAITRVVCVRLIVLRVWMR